MKGIIPRQAAGYAPLR